MNDFSYLRFYNDNIWLISCTQDYQVNRNCGYRNCDAAFFKDKYNRGILDGIVHRDKEGKSRVGYPD